ncbi:hypothetical protein DFP93_101305 [Aneurinibacillus soli]|uniref:Uncharacterized protein n=1 Tax=Aneurinibacillus soli TaxID=1500254 RepID=A0A0U4NHK5_9BACL|nr:hypothetical protein [Aneurinibacillus soli]PYE64279.1 hypothetical protein DFP93_101305 [Aneurinibacillus soli]BAU28228.1 hypothetical protein CB4_02402 [Aneurinibacillus soli]
MKFIENRRTIVPKRDMSVNKPAEVKTYILPPEELKKYRSMPQPEQERTYHTWERSSKWQG